MNFIISENASGLLNFLVELFMKPSFFFLFLAVQHERGPRKPKIHPQLHGHPHHHHGQLGHHHHQNPHHLPVSLVTNVSASFNYTSHIQTGQGHHSLHHLPHHQTQLHHHPIGFPHLFAPVHPNLIDGGKLSDILPAFDLTASNSSSGGNSDFYKTSASLQHYSSPSPSNSIQSISSVGGTPSEETSASPKLNVETTPSATPPPSCSAQEASLMLTNNNNLNSVNNNNGRQNGFLELLLGPDKCQELIQHQMHNSLIHPTPHSLIGMDSRLLSWEMLQETTARLLFMAVRWVKCLVPFQTLSKCDQQLLLQVGILLFYIYTIYML